MAANPVEHIVAGLTPYIGAHMARSAAEAHCRKLGFDGQDLTAEQVERLVARLETGLHVFIGREKTALVMAGIRQGLVAGG